MQNVINMSDFVSHDLLPDLWDEIIKRLWTYLEREESVQKIEERNKLESCLKDFLCIVPQDRRFFLPETAEVLKRTVLELKNFSANKAIIGFEALFQYASNLFTKPWRKEYHVLKMYSGFYQHEVQSNLVDAIKIFEAMGYRQLSENLLILDGPICPDQVISVARDAMAAYIECQIMKQIYLGLEALNLDCTWQEVFKFREKNIGGTTQAIKNLANAIQERKLRKDKMSTLDNFYSSVQQQPNAHYQNCSSFTQTNKYAATPYYGTQNGHCAMHPPTMTQTHCSVHANTNSNSSYIYNNNVNKLIASYPAPSNPYVHQHHHYAHTGNQPHMSHSRSLEQYSEPQPLLPHRHSFDHQHQGCMSAHHYQQPSYPQMHVYESPYDCVDSTGSNASYAIVAASPYNVSGNRFPLPYSISSQLNADATVTCNGVKAIEPYGNPDNLYATVSKANTCSLHHTAPAARCVPTTTKDFNTYRQRSFPPDQHLIDFDDRAPLTAHDYHGQYQALTQNNSFDGSYEQSTRQAKRAVNRLTANYAHTNTPIISPVAIESDQYGYARPLPRSSRNRSNAALTEKYLKQVQHALENDSEDITRNSAHLLNPYEDFVHVGMSEKVRVSPTQAIKNQDGVGSFETWNTVYQNLERTGYASDVSDRDRDRDRERERDRERVELLKNLDLKALQLGNSTGSTTDTDVERRRVTELKAGRQNLDKVRNLEKSSKVAEERSAQSVLPTTNGLKKGTLSTNNVIAQNNNNEIIVAGKDVRRVPELSKRSPRNIQTNSKTPSSSLRQVNDSKEWSCRYCTFLNPEAERVCEMCSKSKNFNLESAPSHAPTCV